jgi:hypothetical protein
MQSSKLNIRPTQGAKKIQEEQPSAMKFHLPDPQ